MNLLEKILNSKNEDIEKIITEEINIANKNSIKVRQLGFLGTGINEPVFKGFIPLETKIKYTNIALETYSMNTIDFFYEFARYIRKYNINNKALIVYNLELFINIYFGLPSDRKREEIFNELAWNSTKTDEEYFRILENNKIGDLKGSSAAKCTERSALAQQILSLFGFEVYYCIGSIKKDKLNEFHCFNIVKRKNDYARLDYSIPVMINYSNDNVQSYLPFIGIISNEEFKSFVNEGIIKEFSDYKYINSKKQILDSIRCYNIGIEKLENIKSDIKR